MSRSKRVKVYFELEQDQEGYPPVSSEFLWCLPTGRGTYIVDNIPFFVRDVSLEDEISAKKAGRVLWFSGLLKKSRNSTVRVLLKKPDLTIMIREKLENLGCGSELMDDLSLIAITMPRESSIAEALAFLDQQCEYGNIGIEESAVRYRDVQ